MQVNRPSFASPLLCIDDFLPAEDADAILRECIDLRKIYMPARVFDAANGAKVDTKYRKNEIIDLNSVFSDAPERSDILSIIRRRIWEDDCRALWHEGDYIFDIINYATSHETILSHYGQGDFYKKHQDTRRDYITRRLVTLVYYANQTPESFRGGSIVFSRQDERVSVEPRHNRAVVFPSFTIHEVEPVEAADSDWEKGRFSLNYWLGFR